MLLVPGSQLGDEPDTCYLGVFGSPQAGTTWSMGTMFFSQYYIVYDASRLASENILQLGIAPKSKQNDLLGRQYDPAAAGYAQIGGDLSM